MYRQFLSVPVGSVIFHRPPARVFRYHCHLCGDMVSLGKSIIENHLIRGTDIRCPASNSTIPNWKGILR